MHVPSWSSLLLLPALLLVACDAKEPATPAVNEPSVNTEAAAPTEPVAAEGVQANAQGSTAAPGANPPAQAAPQHAHNHDHHGHDHAHHGHHHHNHEPPAPIELAEGECVGVTPAQIAAATAYTTTPETPTALGSSPPAFALQDVQALSCGKDQTYGLAPFQGKVTLVTLLSAGCGFCQNQTTKLEQMRIELGLQGLDVHMIAINAAGQDSIVAQLTNRGAFPVFQDTQEANVWNAFTGRKDDIFVYDASHRLTAFFRSGQEPDLNLGSDAGYANVRAALLAAAGR